MRPLRFLLTVFASAFAFILLVHLFPFSSVAAEEDFQESSRIRAYFNWRTPSSLFPPSAVISLTDDNSTFFLARPAAFGPLLPARSLSGQLWVGNGFDFDEHGRIGGGYGAGGELGCSDVPGWDISDVKAGSGRKSSKTSGNAVSDKNEGSKMRRSVGKDANDSEDTEQQKLDRPDKSDGTDDHLHHPLPPSQSLNEGASKGKKAAHADIQSLQESAEIAGKVVLLSRGGCGFLEKVKWVQRRGGVALIVGDDIRGGPLVTMYARGDTSNVTIPSLFTSHTTAHLLSSLVPSGRGLEDLSPEDAARLGLVLGEGDRAQKGHNRNEHTGTSAAVKPSSTSKARKDGKNATPLRDREGPLDDEVETVKETNWLRSLFGSSSQGNGGSRPPSSGNLLWVRQEEFEDDVPKHKHVATASTPALKKQTPTSSQRTGPTDGFRIGIQDWRDPDLVAEQKEHHVQSTSLNSGKSTSATSQESKGAGKEKLKGGSITPGSGEYSSKKPSSQPGAGREAADGSDSNVDLGHQEKHSGGWLSNLFASSEPEQNIKNKDSTRNNGDSHISQKGSATKQSSYTDHHPSIADGASEHDGLWVTLTPTSMSSSPFFDTLLVLVVSPLVTLTVVYALLLLRSRIRRRRWRAPKSVVERLPVRTYQTMPSNSPSTASTTSSVSSLNVTTPLLSNEAVQGARPITARSRPRSRTASEFQSAQAGSSLRSSETNSIASPSLEQMEEKRAAGLAEWRRRYGGKQRECVVCLEEYVDGVSRVMSLPCGHEFHEGCITPWLTTRRRTCPICKGDVVRSLGRSSSTANPSPLASHVTTHNYSSYSDSSAATTTADEESEREVQEQAALTHNDDPASQHPISREDEAFEDLERGVVDRNR